MRLFEEVLFSQATYKMKTEKQAINSLSLCQLDTGMLTESPENETDEYVQEMKQMNTHRK